MNIEDYGRWTIFIFPTIDSFVKVPGEQGLNFNLKQYTNLKPEGSIVFSVGSGYMAYGFSNMYTHFNLVEPRERLPFGQLCKFYNGNNEIVCK